jgi:hypothetical protein
MIMSSLVVGLWDTTLLELNVPKLYIHKVSLFLGVEVMEGMEMILLK